jgi:hypothetical protein
MERQDRQLQFWDGFAHCLFAPTERGPWDKTSHWSAFCKLADSNEDLPRAPRRQQRGASSCSNWDCETALFSSALSDVAGHRATPATAASRRKQLCAESNVNGPLREELSLTWAPLAPVNHLQPRLRLPAHQPPPRDALSSTEAPLVSSSTTVTKALSVASASATAAAQCAVIHQGSTCQRVNHCDRGSVCCHLLPSSQLPLWPAMASQPLDQGIG